ncbi:MAG: hypothetical protein QT04_C0028G0004, partial [archaeon GW2011_AR11]
RANHALKVAGKAERASQACLSEVPPSFRPGFRVYDQPLAQFGQLLPDDASTNPPCQGLLYADSGQADLARTTSQSRLIFPVHIQ